ncbi:erythromycin esterase family protein, partial [Bacillus thuringiensis]|nr:erythromycin esterase family protein [Bacillus thuringiensis]
MNQSCFTNNSIEVEKMNKKSIIAMVSTALLVTGCAEVGKAQTVAVENS